MGKRTSVRVGAIAALILLVLAQAVPAALPRHAAATAPNIVVVMVDDMPARMVADLPGIQSLFTDRGLSFTAFYAPAPQCCPSRASILRGQYPHNTVVLKNDSPQGGYGAFRNNGHEASTIATWLQDAGYRTALIGKYLNGYERAVKHVPPGWNRWFAYAGEGKYTTYDVSDQGKLRTYGKKKRNSRKWHDNQRWSTDPVPDYLALRTLDILYMRYRSGERELYDYESDPYELDNLLANWSGHTPDPAAETRADELGARMQELSDCAGATCR